MRFSLKKHQKYLFLELLIIFFLAYIAVKSADKGDFLPSTFDARPPSCERSYVKTKISRSDLLNKIDEQRQWLRRISDNGGDLASLYQLRKHRSEGNTEGRIILCNQDFSGLDLRDLDLTGMDLSYSDFSKANLQRAKFRDTDLHGSCFADTDLSDVDASGAYFVFSTFPGAKFKNANLLGASFESAVLLDTDLTGSVIHYAQLAGLSYVAKADPMIEFEGVEGLADVTFPAPYGRPYAPTQKQIELDFNYRPAICGSITSNSSYGGPSSLIRLRKALQDSGQRYYERQATAAIENTNTHYLMSSNDLREKIDGWSRYVLFDVTTAYGQEPGRALRLLLAIVGLCSVVFFIHIAFLKTNDRVGIFRLLPKDRFVSKRGGYKLLEQKVQKVTLSWKRAYPYALLFSVLSAFQLGWKDFNIGNWIARIQPREYSLVAKGWLRTFAGLETVVCLYLLAIWALTYFGRPFD